MWCDEIIMTSFVLDQQIHQKSVGVNIGYKKILYRVSKFKALSSNAVNSPASQQFLSNKQICICSWLLNKQCIVIHCYTMFIQCLCYAIYCYATIIVIYYYYSSTIIVHCMRWSIYMHWSHSSLHVFYR